MLVLVLLPVEVEVALGVAVELEVALGVAVELEVALAVAVELAVALAVAVELAVAVAELEVSSETSCVPMSVSNHATYWLFITLRTASTMAVFFIVHLIGRSATTVPLYSL